MKLFPVYFFIRPTIKRMKYRDTYLFTSSGASKLRTDSSMTYFENSIKHERYPRLTYEINASLQI